jgi:hypothetical protein
MRQVFVNKSKTSKHALRPHCVHPFHFSVCQTPARARTTPPITGASRPKDPRPSLPRYQSLDTRPGPARQQSVGRRTGPDRQPSVGGPQGGPARQNQLDTRPRLASVRRQRISVDLEALDSPVSTDSRSSSMVRFFGLCKLYFFVQNGSLYRRLLVVFLLTLTPVFKKGMVSRD